MQARILEMWLARAGSVPIFCHIKYKGALNFHVHHLVSKLVPHVSRWKNIHLQLPIECLTPLFAIHQVDAPLLKSLTVKHIHFGATSVLQHTPPIEFVRFPGGARLREMQIDIPHSCLPKLHLPWAQLEELTLTESSVRGTRIKSRNSQLTLNDALDILRRLPNLRCCTLGIGHQLLSVPSVPIVVPIVVPRLQKLFLHAEPTQFGLFLESIILPQLEKLTIYGHCGPELQPFLGRSNHPIKELDFIRVCDMSADELFNCLQLVPSLTHLQCTFPVGELILRALTPSTLVDNSLSCLCPHLNFVEFRCHHPFNALAEMIEGRWESRSAVGVSQLKRARLHLRCKPDLSLTAEADLIKRLQKCADAGLDLVWSL